MSLSRRDLLTTFLGLPIALAGCSSAAPSLPEGDILGASADVGHRLRQNGDTLPTSWETVKTVIVGGGASGLAAGWQLTRKKRTDFLLLEMENETGGTARFGQNATGRYPWGAHYVPAPLAENTLLIELLKEMGYVEGTADDGHPIISEEILCRDPDERLFYRGRWYEGLYLSVGESAEEARQRREFQKQVDFWIRWRDARGRKAFAIPVRNASDDPEVYALDGLTMAEWLNQRGFTSARLRWLVDYACRDDYGASMEQVSAWAGLFYFCSRQKAAGVESQSMMTWPEGNGRFVEHLRKSCGGEIRSGWLVRELIPVVREGRAGVDIVLISRDGQQVRGIHADRVILAVPRFVAKYMIRDWRANPPAFLNDFEYGVWVVANLLLRDRPTERGFEPAWDNVLYESPSLGYVVNTHQPGIDFGATTFTWYYAMCEEPISATRNRLLSLSRDEIADIALTDLTRCHGDIREQTQRLDIMKWGHAMVRPRPGFFRGRSRKEAMKPFRNIHFAGADLSGLALFEEALDQGVRAAEEVLEAGH